MTHSSLSTWLRRTGGAASTIGAALLWAVVPKCPLCIAAWLVAAGIGASYAATLAVLLRPVALVLLTVAALWILIGIARRGRRHCCSGPRSESMLSQSTHEKVMPLSPAGVEVQEPPTLNC